MMFFPESLCASDEVSGPIFCKLFRKYIYRLLHGVYMFQMANAFSMSFMSLNVYLQCTMFDFNIMNGQYANLGFN